MRVGDCSAGSRPAARGDIVGQLFDAVDKINGEIERRGLDVAKTKGEISMKAGFFLAIIFPHTPDDPEKLMRLKAAAKEVLGIEIYV